jgi:chromosomal replication initiator protein
VDTRINDFTGTDRRALQDVGESSQREVRSPDVVGRIIGRLCDEVGPDRYARYFDRQTHLSLTNDTLDVTVSNGFLAELLDRRFGESIRKAAHAETRGQALNLCFKVDQRAFDGGAADAASVSERATQAEAARQRAVAVAPPVRLARQARGVSGGHSLEDFVVGDSNRMAYAAALRVVDDAQCAGISPLFIHGACGLGKTHLLQGLARRFAQTHPGAVVRSTSAEAFTNEYITAIRSSKVDAFRASYRKVDLLVIDDVHFLSNKEATQGELLHTLDAAGLVGARLVLASDEHPREIRKVSAGLVSRFMAGGVVRLDAPDAELCRKLIAHIAAKRGLVMEPSAAGAMAEHAIHRAGPAGVSVRDLEGLVTQVEAVHRLLPEFGGSGGAIGLALVRKATGGDVAPRVRRPVPLGVIADEVCRQLRVQMVDLTGKGRHKRVVLARAMITHLSRRLTTHSFPEIARAIGRPNHSTVITAHKRIAAQMAANERAEIDELGDPFVGLSLTHLGERLERDVVRAAGE